jgi:hypothetical protein
MIRSLRLFAVMTLTASLGGVGCEDASSKDGDDGEAAQTPPDVAAACRAPWREGDPLREPCKGGTVDCSEGDRNMRRICCPDGFGHALQPCPVDEVCDQETKQCQAKVCEPDRFDSCEDAKTSIRCNESGTSLEDVSCHGCVEGGDLENPIPCVCREVDSEATPPEQGGCQPLVCRPDAWKCLGDEQAVRCSDDQTGWEVMDDCAKTGRVCEMTNVDAQGEALPRPMARCLTLCEEDLKTKSYLGCEYWAADLDNAFLSTGAPNSYVDAQGRQFAVVVSNATSGDRQVDATVRTNAANGAIWCKSWDNIATLPESPDSRWCYRSKGECQEGPRCDIVLEFDNGVQVPTEVCVDAEQGGGGCEDHVVVPPGELRILNLPRADLNGTMIGPLAYQIVSDAPITAHQFNPLENEQVFSNDASLLLPLNALGKFYLVMAREQTYDIIRPFTTVIAVRPGETKVTVRSTARTLPGPGIAAMQEGQQRVFTLDQFDVLNLETNCRIGSGGLCSQAVDPTGTEVFGDKLIAVFGGAEAANAPNTNHCVEGACWDGSECSDDSDCGNNITCCADHLEQQMYPVAAWGRRYVASKSARRGDPMGTGLEPDVWRILAGSDDTTVQTIPHQVNIRGPLDRGDWIDFVSTEDFEVVADKAVLVGQYLAAEHAPGPNTRGEAEPGDAETGDPAFMLGVPVEQYRDDYVFLAPNKYEFDFANIVAPTGSRITIDDTPLALADFEPIGEGEFSVLRLRIDDGVHRIRSIHEEDEDRARFGVIVYGYDQYVSYGYPGGLDLKSINKCGADLRCPERMFCCTPADDCPVGEVGQCVSR